MFCLQETHFSFKKTHGLKMKGWKKVFHTSGNQKKAEITLLMLEETDFKPKMVKKRVKEGYYMMIKGLIYHEDISSCKYICPQH